MNPSDLVEFLRKRAWAVEATVTTAGKPQAAVIGVVVSDACELFFDTLASSRKCENLRANPHVAFVIGWDDAQTVQLEGIADEPSGAELERLKALYFARFPDGREREAAGGVAYFRVRPRWARYSDFRGAEPIIAEIRLK
ncbi:MAG TPA: pyridoxamine 5'-phosphate oxidase family protein [Polyangiaceae bacterium]|nr:pyridoxamine 5'-phosphate oxidase family protein [Polyangiaceae bacterium]